MDDVKGPPWVIYNVREGLISSKTSLSLRPKAGVQQWVAPN